MPGDSVRGGEGMPGDSVIGWEGMPCYSSEGYAGDFVREGGAGLGILLGVSLTTQHMLRSILRHYFLL